LSLFKNTDAININMVLFIILFFKRIWKYKISRNKLY